ncbi:hypothetical protein L9F63_015038, partial [Diploptera punctata]
SFSTTVLERHIWRRLPPLQERRSAHRSNVFVINMNKVNTRGKNTLITLLFVIPSAIHCVTY